MTWHSFNVNSSIYCSRRACVCFNGLLTYTLVISIKLVGLLHLLSICYIKDAHAVSGDASICLKKHLYLMQKNKKIIINITSINYSNFMFHTYFKIEVYLQLHIISIHNIRSNILPLGLHLYISTDYNYLANISAI